MSDWNKDLKAAPPKPTAVVTLLRIVSDYAHMSDTLKAAQARCSELLEEKRVLNRENRELTAKWEAAQQDVAEHLRRGWVPQEQLDELRAKLEVQGDVEKRYLAFKESVAIELKAVQARCSELLEENRELRRENVVLTAVRDGEPSLVTPEYELSQLRLCMQSFGFELEPDKPVSTNVIFRLGKLSSMVEEQQTKLEGARKAEWKLLELVGVMRDLKLEVPDGSVVAEVAGKHLRDLSGMVDNLREAVRLGKLDRVRLQDQITEAEASRYNMAVERNQARSDKNQAEQHAKDDRAHAVNFDICQSELNESKAKIHSLENDCDSLRKQLQQVADERDVARHDKSCLNAALDAITAQRDAHAKRLEKNGAILNDQNDGIIELIECMQELQLERNSDNTVMRDACKHLRELNEAKAKISGLEMLDYNKSSAIRALESELEELKAREVQWNTTLGERAAQLGEMWERLQRCSEALEEVKRELERERQRTSLGAKMIDECVSHPFGQQLEDERHRAEYAEQDLRDCVLALDGQPVPERLVRSQDGYMALKRVKAYHQEREIRRVWQKELAEERSTALQQRDDARKQIEAMREQLDGLQKKMQENERTIQRLKDEDVIGGLQMRLRQLNREVEHFKLVCMHPVARSEECKLAGPGDDRCIWHMPHPMFPGYYIQCLRTAGHRTEHVFVPPVQLSAGDPAQYSLSTVDPDAKEPSP